MIAGAEIARRVVLELEAKGRLAADVDVAKATEDATRVVGLCLQEAFRASMAVGPIGAMLDELERPVPAPALEQPFVDEDTTQP